MLCDIQTVAVATASELPGPAQNHNLLKNLRRFSVALFCISVCVILRHQHHHSICACHCIQNNAHQLVQVNILRVKLYCCKGEILQEVKKSPSNRQKCLQMIFLWENVSASCIQITSHLCFLYRLLPTVQNQGVL